MSFLGRQRPRASRASLAEAVTLLRRYVVEEALAPLRHLGRRLGFGVAGGVLAGIGALFILLAFLRIVQGEAGQTFAGTWSFAPYLFTAILAMLMIGASFVVFVRQRRSS